MIKINLRRIICNHLVSHSRQIGYSCRILYIPFLWMVVGVGNSRCGCYTVLITITHIQTQARGILGDIKFKPMDNMKHSKYKVKKREGRREGMKREKERVKENREREEKRKERERERREREWEGLRKKRIQLVRIR